jgi:two-component system, OmpR family, response regulator CpxR
MRPKKVILCVDHNELELSVTTFMLTTKGYRVHSAVNGQQAVAVFAETPVDLVLADHTGSQLDGSQLLRRLKQMGPHVPMILLCDPQQMGSEIPVADALLTKRSCTTAELLERIKTMCTRKRGPRKGGSAMPRHEPEVELAAAS